MNYYNPKNSPSAKWFASHDLLVAEIIQKEEDRQLNTIELIASENFASDQVRAAQGSIFTNKYAEGYPGQRYYGGCVNMDLIENLAIERACNLFGCEYANVQPHSGSQANMAAYYAVLSNNATILSMELSHGGHLTHGAKVNFSGKQFKFIHYPLDKKTEQIDYDLLEDIAIDTKPDLILCGASAYSREINFKRIGEIAKKVNAISMADVAHIAGLIIAGFHQTPFPYIDIATSTTHKTLRGPRGGLILTNDGGYIGKINKAVFPGIQGGPLMQVILAKAIAFGEAQDPEFVRYIGNIVRNTKAFADAMDKEGWRIISGGTDNHLFLIDLKSHDVMGKWAQDTLDEVNITANMNAIPYDKQSPKNPSGLRLGAAAMTTRGFGVEDFEITARLITDTLLKRRDNKDIRVDVAALLSVLE